ncbi:MAG: hypothetical protein KME27_23325 [Lyngbya sp. HA4199-MV5]|jgi:hypothetical protein|nr:hypothetical protein [Lyngbya sp. HA4199-MV5]
MSNGATTLSSKADGDRFPSLASLRVAHSELLKLHRERGNEPEVLVEIEQLIHKGQSTGALLDIEEDRWAAQSLLDYWSSLLYRAGQEPPDATLIDFDPSLAPDLNNDLCPYIGLEAFREKNQNLFFGRQRLVDKLLKHLEINRLLIVVGSSGSGKSSVVLGGLLPRLLTGMVAGSQDWFYYAPLVPSSDPLTALARRVKPANVPTTEWIPQQTSAFKQDSNHLMQLTRQRDHQPVVLIIDQFEEVFTLCHDDEARQAVIKNLLHFVQTPDARNILILTMRTDFESQFVRTPDLLPLFEQYHIRMTALDAGELRETIEKPAEMVGLKFEEGLVEALLSDVLGEPAALPLLQFTLLKLWDNREHNRLTWESYRRLGGGRLALAKSADAFYSSLIPEEQFTVKRILLRMIRPSEGLEVTSNRIPREKLYLSGEARDRVDRVLNKLIYARLVRLTEGDSLGDAQVEVAHEALIRNWPQLVDWLEDERSSLRQRLRLTSMVEHWLAQNREPDLLLRGTQLEQALQFNDLNDLEEEFIKCSETAEKDRLDVERRQIQENLRLEEEKQRLESKLRLRKQIAFISTAIAVSIGILSLWAVYQKDRAEKAENYAKEQRAVALQALKQANDEKLRFENASKRENQAKTTNTKLQKELEKLKEQVSNGNITKESAQRLAEISEQISTNESTNEPLPPSQVGESGPNARVAVVFDPPSNIRVSPNGAILCKIQKISSINIFNSNGEWYYTDYCGNIGVIHSSQIKF